MRAYLSEAEIYNDYDIPPLIQSLNEIKQEFSRQVFLKAIEKEQDDEKEEGEEGDDSNKIENIVGSVRGCLEKETVYIGRLIVKPEYQNKGIGTKLMQAIEQYLNRLIAMSCLQDTRVLGIYTYIKSLATMNSREYLWMSRLRLCF
jgi:ribosomal protein S18 acetylase RimI-like enzyme